MDIYYRVDGPEMINVEYQPENGGEKIYDFFKSFYHLSSWVEVECDSPNLIEITEDNYEELKNAGKIS